ncbi:interleukin-17B-like [Haplochromis burtoni]|uniref:Interleukin-17B-like n=1 Tax=Haplochromis burtoni TaxID=8153 RepID=A0A3Q3D0L1_HAPBU|nr:interleukin-17B-like [Haplochromis burtoni]
MLRRSPWQPGSRRSSATVFKAASMERRQSQPSEVKMANHAKLSLTVSATLHFSLLILYELRAEMVDACEHQNLTTSEQAAQQMHELRPAASRCLSAEKVEARERKFDVNLKKLDLQRDAREHQELTTCEQAAQQMHELNGRALSPWRYYIDRNDSRYPRDIIFAECLCKGCIIDGREVNSYNSVEVRAPMVVLMKTTCKDADTYRVRKTRIEVPLGCTCVRPKITK